MIFTVIGASGFIGGALSDRLAAAGHMVYRPGRGHSDVFSRSLGHVIYAAGVTSDFRSRPFDTLRAHTLHLAEVLERARFDSLTYVSSARLYRHADHGGETAAIHLRSEDPEDLYDLTKLTGEALCHALKRPGVRVVRLTNVVGADFASHNFLFDLIRAACDQGRIELRSARESTKDYVLLEDVLEMLPRIALTGRASCYNLGGGRNIAHAEILAPILARTGATLNVSVNALVISTPEVDIRRLREEFGYDPAPVLPRLPELIDQYRKSHHAED